MSNMATCIQIVCSSCDSQLWTNKDNANDFFQRNKRCESECHKIICFVRIRLSIWSLVWHVCTNKSEIELERAYMKSFTHNKYFWKQRWKQITNNQQTNKKKRIRIQRKSCRHNKTKSQINCTNVLLSEQFKLDEMQKTQAIGIWLEPYRANDLNGICVKVRVWEQRPKILSNDMELTCSFWCGKSNTHSTAQHIIDGMWRCQIYTRSLHLFLHISDSHTTACDEVLYRSIHKIVNKTKKKRIIIAFRLSRLVTATQFNLYTYLVFVFFLTDLFYNRYIDLSTNLTAYDISTGTTVERHADVKSITYLCFWHLSTNFH